RDVDHASGATGHKAGADAPAPDAAQKQPGKRKVDHVGVSFGPSQQRLMVMDISAPARRIGTDPGVRCRAFGNWVTGLRQIAPKQHAMNTHRKGALDPRLGLGAGYSAGDGFLRNNAARLSHNSILAPWRFMITPCCRI